MTKQSTAQMMNEESARLKKADDAMNIVYKKLMAKLDATGQKKLKNAQQAWIKFRDADATFDSDLMRGGSGAGLLYIGSVLGSTETRLKELETTLKDRSEL
jgi:uncharacterized protein YecT (DUF1311 family)